MKPNSYIFVVTISTIILAAAFYHRDLKADGAVEKQSAPKPRIIVQAFGVTLSSPSVTLITDTKTGREFLVINNERSLSVINLGRQETAIMVATNSWTNWNYPTNIWIGPGVVMTNIIEWNTNSNRIEVK